MKSNALDKSVKIARKNLFVIHCFFVFFVLSLVEGNAEFQRLLENHIEILIICYQNNLKLSTDQIFKYFDKNWQSTY